jgi:hypothetical protein
MTGQSDVGQAKKIVCKCKEGLAKYFPLRDASWPYKLILIARIKKKYYRMSASFPSL